MRPTLLGAILLAAGLGAAGGTASAQLDNRPYQFSRSGGEVGMSMAHRQAILEAELTGARPDHLVRGPGGTLLTVTEGPGNVPILRQRLQFLPGTTARRGTLRGAFGFAIRDTADLSFWPAPAGFVRYAGVAYAPGSGAYATPASLITSRVIGEWTAMVDHIPPRAR